MLGLESLDPANGGFPRLWRTLVDCRIPAIAGTGQRECHSKSNHSSIRLEPRVPLPFSTTQAMTIY